MPLPRISRYGAAALATAALTIGTLAATGGPAQADPQVIRCAPTAPTYVLGSGQYGASWVGPATLVSTAYNSDNVPVNCRYRGEKYTIAYGYGTVDQGVYYYWRPLFVYV